MVTQTSPKTNAKPVKPIAKGQMVSIFLKQGEGNATPRCKADGTPYESFMQEFRAFWNDLDDNEKIAMADDAASLMGYNKQKDGKYALAS